MNDGVARAPRRATDLRRPQGSLERADVLRGRVVRGEQRGRTLGFPTANLDVEAGIVLPSDGVYAVFVRLDGGRHPAVLSVSLRPTFGEGRRTVEVHLIDFSGDLYERWLVVELVERLRCARRFSGRDALRRAIAADVARVRALLRDHQ